MCGWNEHSRHLYIELSGNDLVEIYNSDYCSQIVKEDSQVDRAGSQNVPALNKVTGVLLRSSPMSVVVDKEDVDWRFILSLTDLTTVRDSRRLRILVPKLGNSFDPKASTWFITGECFFGNWSIGPLTPAGLSKTKREQSSEQSPTGVRFHRKKSRPIRVGLEISGLRV